MLFFLVLIISAVPAPAQEIVPPNSYADPGAVELVRLARARRTMVDTRIKAYSATARERTSVHLDVMGIERLLMRQEMAARVAWTRDTVRVELIGARETQPIVSSETRLPSPQPAALIPLAFDPVDSDMFFRLDSTDIRHPLGPGTEQYYRFASGDTTTIRLPDGREVRLFELRVTARRADPRLINGSFWVDAQTHAVVRAGFRLSGPFAGNEGRISALLPELRGELDHVAIEYGLWDLRWWLPRNLVARGVVTVGGRRVPLAFERSYEDYVVLGDTMPGAQGPVAAEPGVDPRPCRRRLSRDITLSIGGPDSPAARDSAWNNGWREKAERLAAPDTATEDRPACDRAFLVTKAEGDLVRSPVFAASIYEDDEGPVDASELEALADLIGAIPAAPWAIGAPRLKLLTPDLVRFNRVEGLSLGGRVLLPLGPAELLAELRAGTTGEIGVRAGGIYSSPRLRAEVGGYRGIQATDFSSHPFSLGSSVGALVMGRDENDYFRGTGAEILLAPAPARRQFWNLRLFGERQEGVRADTDLSLRGLVDDDFETRSNLAAENIDQLGATLGLRTALGADPERLLTRAELRLHGETGDRTFTRPMLRLEAERLVGRGLGFAASAAAGTGFGEVPLQRHWQIGGAGTVRGHDPASLRGESLWLGRGEVTFGPSALRLSVFGDAGWAGPREDFWRSTPIAGAGVGVALLNNFLRLDLARGIDGGGTRFYLRMGGGL